MATSPDQVAEQTAAGAAAQLPASGSHSLGSVVHVPNGAGPSDQEAGPETAAKVEPPAPAAQPVPEAPTMAELETVSC